MAKNTSEWGWYELAWCLIIYIITAIITYILQVHYKWQNGSAISDKSRILFLTAHPDDECMFFAPTIQSHTELEPNHVYLLCITSGNYRKDGVTRTKELWASTKILGIPSENVTLLNNDYFPDDPNARWITSKLARIILTHIKMLDINVIVTFDEDGISGHANHCALHRAVFYLSSRKLLPNGCRAYALESINIFRKYSYILDVLPAIIFDRRLYISTPKRIRQARQAMYAHCSQMVWFRYLYILTSRYMILNTFSEINEDFNFNLDLT